MNVELLGVPPDLRETIRKELSRSYLQGLKDGRVAQLNAEIAFLKIRQEEVLRGGSARPHFDMEISHRERLIHHVNLAESKEDVYRDTGRTLSKLMRAVDGFLNGRSQVYFVGSREMVYYCIDLVRRVYQLKTKAAGYFELVRGENNELSARLYIRPTQGHEEDLWWLRGRKVEVHYDHTALKEQR